MHWRRRIIFFLYRILGWLLLPLLLLYFLRRILRQPDYGKNIIERFGFLPAEMKQAGHSSIWLHAVSVGEIAAADGLIRELRTQFPFATVFVSSSTVAGRRLAEDRLGNIVDGIFYLPADYCFAVRRVLAHIKPVVVVILETEIWPNLYHEVKKTFAGLLIVNGRISGRAISRYQKFRWLFREVLDLPDAILAQDQVSRNRFALLMDRKHHLSIGGNLKYDQSSSAKASVSVVVKWVEELRPSHVWIAASTMPPAKADDPDEDDVIVDAIRHLSASFPRLLLILAPRRPERFDRAAALLREAGIPCVRRSELQPESTLELPGVLLLDSIGELAGLFSLADVVFVGGTLNHRGGHNILEPAQAGRAIVIGPHMENFPEIIADFREAESVAEIREPADLAPAIEDLLKRPGERKRLGEKALSQARKGRGATARCIAEIGRFYQSCIPRDPRSWWHYVFLWPLSRLWKVGAAWDQQRKRSAAKRLPRPVVSIGNITAGGAGKTPVALWMLEGLRREGFSPAILTRGYKRLSRDPILILGPDERPPRTITGDEAQIFLARGGEPIGIGTRRYDAGMALLERFPVDAFVLDDGMQHVQLERDFELVVIDALQPFGARDPLPLGRLREPMEALRRADLFLITRSESGARINGIESTIRRYNSKAPIFRARVQPQFWVDARTGEQFPIEHLEGKATVAFCGLANPNSFFQTARGLKLRIKSRVPFPDHHVYRPAQLKRLDALAAGTGSAVLVTTEKDAQNLEAGWEQALRQSTLYWLRIGVEVDGGDELLSHVEEKLRKAGVERQADPVA